MIKEKNKLERIEDKLNDLLEPKKKKKKKGFRMPFNARIGRKKLKQNYVTVMVINENRCVDFQRHQINDQTIMVNDIPRLASGEYILNYKNKPLMVLPNCSVEPLKPFSPSENFKESLDNGSNSTGYRLLLNAMKAEAIQLKKKIGGLGMSIGALIIIGVIVYAIVAG